MIHSNGILGDAKSGQVRMNGTDAFNTSNHIVGMELVWHLPFVNTASAFFAVYSMVQQLSAPRVGFRQKKVWIYHVAGCFLRVSNRDIAISHIAANVGKFWGCYWPFFSFSMWKHEIWAVHSQYGPYGSIGY